MGEVPLYGRQSVLKFVGAGGAGVPVRTGLPCL